MKLLFQLCTSLKHINIPDSVIEIGDYAFSECTSLENMKIPHLITKIRAFTFLNCISLNEISIPHSLEIKNLEKQVKIIEL